MVGFILCCGTVLLFNRPTLGWQLLSVPTGSMRPGMPPGSLVLTHRVSDSSLRVGDVITYTNPLTMRSTLTHRIIKVYKLDGKVLTFITKGDANPSPDPPVVAGLVQGIRVGHLPFVGYLFMWAKTWIGIAVLIYLPALVIMVEETRRLSAYLRKMRPYRLNGWATPKRSEQTMRPKLALAGSTAAAVMIIGFGWQTAGALGGSLHSNTVALAPNMLVVAKKHTSPPPTNCSSNSNVNTTNSTTQTSTTGNSQSSNGGDATSGNSTNNNDTNINITTNGC